MLPKERRVMKYVGRGRRDKKRASKDQDRFVCFIFIVQQKSLSFNTFQHTFIMCKI